MARKALLGALAVGVTLIGGAASAQTAQQYQQATAALQLCGSATGALIPECAAIRGAFVGNPMGMVGALNASGATGVANAYGLNNANAAANMLANSGITAAQAAQMNALAPTTTAMGIAGAAQAYQACAVANPTNWQSCLPLLNGGQAVPAASTAQALTPAQTAAIQQAQANAAVAAQAAAAAAVRALDPLAAQAAANQAAQVLQSTPMAAPRAPTAPANPMSVLGF